MPTAADIDISDLVDQPESFRASPSPETTPATGGKSRTAIDIDVSDLIDPEMNPKREPTFLGEFGRAAVAPFKALAKSPKLLLDNEDELYTEIVKEHARQQSVGEGGIASKAGQIAGGLAGGVAEFVGATAAASETGPAAPFLGPGVAFGATGSWESAMSAGVRALAEGKPKSEVVRIARQMAGVGAAVGAATAVGLGATSLIPKTATALARTLGTAAIGAGVGGGGQVVENLAEKSMGLEVSPTEGVLEQALIMGLLPVVSHAKDLYRQARGVAATDPAKAKELQSKADEAAAEELKKANVPLSPPAETAKAPETPQPQAEPVSTQADLDKAAAEANKPPTPPEASGGVTTPPEPPPTPPAPQGEATQAVPESSPEAKPSVTTEVSPTKAAPEQSGAAIRSFQMQNGRSKVEILPPFEVGGKPQQNFRVNGKTVIGLDELKQEYPLAYEKLIADYPEFKPTTEGDKNAIQPETTQPLRDVQQKPGSKPNEVPPEGGRPPNDERGGEGTAQAPESEAPKKQPLILGTWPENEWTYAHLKTLTMAQRSDRARFLGMRTKDGMLELSSKKLADRAAQRFQEMAKEKKPTLPVEPVTEPVTSEIGPVPTADQLIAMSPGDYDPWKKRTGYNEAGRKKIGESLTAEDIPKLQAERDRLEEQTREMRKTMDPRSDAQMMEHNEISLKSQTIKEAIDAFKETHPEAKPTPDVMPSAEGEGTSENSPLQEEIIDEKLRRQNEWEKRLESVISNLPDNMKRQARQQMREAISRPPSPYQGADPPKGWANEVLERWKKQSKEAESWPTFTPDAAAHGWSETGKPTKPTAPSPENEVTPTTDITSVAEHLSPLVPDVTEQRARVRAVDVRQAELRDEQKKIEAELKALEPKVTVQRGAKWMKGRIKASAKASDLKQYRELQTKLNEKFSQLRALDDAAKKDRAAIDEAVNAEVISDPKKPLLRRLDRAVRAAQDKGTPPAALIDARDAETTRVIREKYPDATKEEIARLAPQVQAGQYFYDDPWKDQNIPKLEELRRGALDTEVEKSGLFSSFPQELQDKILRYSKAKRQYGEKPSPVDPVEDLSAKDLAALRKEIPEATKKVVENNAVEAKRQEAEKVAEQAKEEKLLADAQKVANSAKRTGTVGGRSAKEVRDELVGNIKGAINETLDQDKTTIKQHEDGSYVAEGESGALAFGEIEETGKGKFKVTARHPSIKERSFSTTVDTVEEAKWVIKTMASVGKGKAIIAVPGDGVYRLHRYGESLLNLWKDAKSIDTSGGQKKAPVSTQGVSEADAKDYLKEAKEFATAKELGGKYYAKRGNEWWEIQRRAERTTETETIHEELPAKKVTDEGTISKLESKSAIPTGEGHTIEGARAEAEKAFGTLSDRVSFVHEPDNPSGAWTDRNKIVVNAAKVAPGTVEKVMLEEGLHGVWNEPSVQDAWKAFRNSVTTAEIDAERAKRQGLDTSPGTLKEEAAISKLLNKPDAPLAKRVWDAIIATLDKVFGVKVGDDRATLIEAAKGFLKGEKAGEGDSRRFATPTTGRAPIEQYTEALKGVKGEKAPLSERFKEAFDIGSRMSTAKDALGKAFSGLKATGDWIADKYEGVEKIDDLLREKGLLSKSTETRGWQVRQWEKEAKKAVPRARDQAAVRKWVDAGGDAAELRRGMAETKPEYRQAYEDALNLSPDLLKAAQETRKYFEQRLDEAIDAGVLEQGVEDYIHRMYESRPEEARKAMAYVQSGILKANPAMAKKRVFAMDWEAEKAGFRPVQSFIPAVAEYETSLSRAIAARRFIGKATTMLAPDGRPVVDIKGVGIPIENQEGERTGTLIKPQFNPSKANKPGTPNYRADYVNKEFPALSKWKWVSADSDGKPIFVQGDVAIHPDFVHRINALLEPSQVRYGRYGAVLRPALALGSAFKQTMLDLSMFHQVQISVHAMEHKVNPFNLVRDIDFQNPNVEGLLKGGVTLGGDYRYNKEGLVGSSLTRQIPILGPALESYHQWLFQDFIPRVKMTMALKAMERNRGRYPGMPEEQIFQKTASQANAAFGELNYVMMERSKTTQDIARLIMLAPDFLEARGRFAGESFSKLFSRTGNEQRTALLLGALTLYTAARVLNKSTEDQWHFEPENAFSWVHKGQAYSLRTVQGDILHLIDKPLNFWMHRLNPLYSRTLLEAVTQRDSFGRKRSASEMLWDTVSTAIPISLRTSRERTLWESMVNAFGVTDRRWQDTDDAFKMAKKWKADHGVGERGEFIYDPEKDPLRGLKVALSHQDDSGAAVEIKKLVDNKTYTMPKLDQYFQRYSTMPFTGSRANDAKWKAGLSEDESKTVTAAREHKKAILQLYRKAKGQLAQVTAGS